jgi:hypothetical protein
MRGDTVSKYSKNVIKINGQHLNSIIQTYIAYFAKINKIYEAQFLI